MQKWSPVWLMAAMTRVPKRTRLAFFNAEMQSEMQERFAVFLFKGEYCAFLVWSGKVFRVVDVYGDWIRTR